MTEEINNLKIEIAVINEKLDNQNEKIDEILVTLKQHITEEDGRYKEIWEHKADKVEVDRIRDNLSKIVWIVLSAVALALLSLILK